MGRIPTGKIPRDRLQHIRGKHLEIIRRMIAGESQRKIAHDLGMSDSRISIICNSPIFKREYARIEAEVKERFVEKTSTITVRVNELQPKAVETLATLLTESKINDIRISPSLKRDVALDLLDLGGNGKKSKELSLAQNVKSNAMEDVVKIISEGFALAKEAMKVREKDLSNREVLVNPGEIRTKDSDISTINITPEDISFTEDNSSIVISPKKDSESLFLIEAAS